jgi:putative hydrolase
LSVIKDENRIIPRCILEKPAKPARRQPKAYEDTRFLGSKDARALRILAEYLEPLYRFERNNVRDTIVFMGSARLRSEEAAKAALAEAQQTGQGVETAQTALRLSIYYEAAQQLARRALAGERVDLLDLVLSGEQREVVDRITGVMSLLEGHADVVMDGVGPEVIPTVDEIRRKFNKRRKGHGSLDRLLRRALGLDAKMAQYRNGAAFVRAVVDGVGMEGFNKVWVEPENLPSKSEIADPGAWVDRVL